MPYELSDLITKRLRMVTIDATGDGAVVINVGYSPDAMTPDVWAGLQSWVKSHGEEEADPFAVAEFIVVPLMRTITITENGETQPLSIGGKPFPIDVEHVAGLGLDLLRSIAGALQADFWKVRDTSDAKKESAAPSLALVTQGADTPTGT